MRLLNSWRKCERTPCVRQEFGAPGSVDYAAFAEAGPVCRPVALIPFRI